MSVGQERNMLSKITISVLFVFCIIGFGASATASFKIAKLEQNVEAHKLAMVYANKAIHTFHNETIFLKDKGIN
tara:strand:- start:1817 stop:2038 length:222 start_codon:yes stop_codon:yes gene_type:complete